MPSSSHQNCVAPPCTPLQRGQLSYCTLSSLHSPCYTIHKAFGACFGGNTLVHLIGPEVCKLWAIKLCLGAFKVMDPMNFTIGSRGDLDAQQGRGKVDLRLGNRLPRGTSRKWNHGDLEKVVAMCERANSAPCGLRNCKMGRPRELVDIEEASPPDPMCPTWSPFVKIPRLGGLGGEPWIPLQPMPVAPVEPLAIVPLEPLGGSPMEVPAFPIEHAPLALEFFEEAVGETDFGSPEVEETSSTPAASFDQEVGENESFGDKEWWTKEEVRAYVEKAMEETEHRVEVQLGGTVNTILQEMAGLKHEVDALTTLVAQMQEVMKKDADIIEDILSSDCGCPEPLQST